MIADANEAMKGGTEVGSQSPRQPRHTRHARQPDRKVKKNRIHLSVVNPFVRWLGLYLFLCSVDKSKRTEFVCTSSTRSSAGSDCSTYSYVQ